MAEVQQIAAGHNQAALLKPFYALSGSLFTHYRRAIRQKAWKSYQGKALTGVRLDKTWGKPSLELFFGRLSRAEFAYLAALAGYVTVRVLNEDTNTWANYDATLRAPTAGDFDKAGNAYLDVTADLIDLDAL